MAVPRPKSKRRPKGEGSIVHRSDGRWMYSLDLGKNAAGSRQRRTIYAPTRAALLRRVQDERARGGGVLQAREPGSVGEFLTDWLADAIEPNRAATTYALYSSLLAKHVIPIIGRARIDRFDTDSVDALYRRMREAGVSASVLNSCARILRSAFAERARRKRCANPFSIVETPRYTPDEVHPLGVEQARAFLAAARESPVESLFVLALAGGLRLGEVLALKWLDIDQKAGTIRVSRALKDVRGKVTIEGVKTKRAQREVPLSRLATESLERRRVRAREEGHGSEFIHVGPTGAHLRPSYVRRRYLAPILEDAGIEHTTIHGLRHAFATFSAAIGTPLRTIGDAMGHSRPSLTIDVYQHSDQTAQRAAIDKLDEYLAPNAKRRKKVPHARRART